MARPCRSALNVIRRVGGLEVYRIRHTCIPFVIRRVGGLEVFAIPILSVVPVIRRVGGLEGIAGDRAVVRKVIRRVGGLEVSGRTPSHFIGITPFRGQLPTTPKEKGAVLAKKKELG